MALLLVAVGAAVGSTVVGGQAHGGGRDGRRSVGRGRGNKTGSKRACPSGKVARRGARSDRVCACDVRVRRPRARASVCVQLSKQAGEDKAFGQFERWYNEDAEATFNQTRAEIAVSCLACACMHTHLRW